MVATLEVRVIPKASKSEVVGLRQGIVRVRIAAPPVEGKANQALIVLLAERLGLRPSDVRIIRGASSRNKLVCIEGMEQEEVLAILGNQA
ncbi:MAG: DUF167 domain-containing protein [Dehalococcoidia bacterium]